MLKNLRTRFVPADETVQRLKDGPFDVGPDDGHCHAPADKASVRRRFTTCHDRTFVRLIAMMTFVLVGGVGNRLAAQDTPRPCASDDRLVTRLGERHEFQDSSTVTGEGLENNVPVGTSGARDRYLRLLLQRKGANTGWSLAIRDEAFRVLQTYGPEDFKSEEPIWTPRLLVPQVYLDLKRDTGNRSTEFTVLAYIKMPEGAPSANTYYSLKSSGNPDYKPLEQLEKKEDRKWADAVGFLVTGWNSQIWTCSGVAVTENLFLTNWHCGRVFSDGERGRLIEQANRYWIKQSCQDATIDFSWDGDQISQDFSCTEVVAKNQALDYALLRMTPVGPSRTVRPAVIRRTKAEAGESLVVIHHPSSRRKQVSSNCTVKNANLHSWRGEIPAARFGHDCDTEGGSSGAPVFDKNGNLLGLHHHGFDVKETPPSVPGGAPGCTETDSVNKAIHIDAILNDLAGNPALAKRADVRHLLNVSGR